MAYERPTDYIDVASRIVEFRTKHPNGSLQPARPDRPFEIIEVNGVAYLAYGAAAYRSPDDPLPGIGYAYELVPGKTPYTRGSELQNAETSAWGRAIVAALAADTKEGIASAEEVRNRQAERDAPPVATDQEWLKGVVARLADADENTLAAIEGQASAKYHGGQLAAADAKRLRAAINQRRAHLSEGEAADAA